MKSLKKRIISILLVATMCATFSPAVLAEDNRYSDEGVLPLEEVGEAASTDTLIPELLEYENPNQRSILPEEDSANAVIIGEQFLSEAMANPSGSRGPAPDLSYVGIMGIWLGNNKYSDNFNDGSWLLKYSNSYAPSTVTQTFEATGYDYIRIRVKRMGYCNFYDETLNYMSYERSNIFRYLDQYGNTCPVGGTVYGWETDYIFSISYGYSVANARFHYIKSGSPFVELEANAYLTLQWADPAPTNLAINYNTVADKATITGVNTSMEYREVDFNGNAYTSWIPITGSALNLDIYTPSYICQIRYKAVSGGIPSQISELTVKAPSAGPLGYFGYNNIDEYILLDNINSPRPIEIALGDGASYSTYSSGFCSLESFINAILSGGFNRVYIRYAATANEPASSAYFYTLYSRNPNTPVDVFYASGALWNLTPNMCFRFNGGDWYSTDYSAVNITAFMSTTSTTLLEIRYMPTSNSSCSAIREVVLPML